MGLNFMFSRSSFEPSQNYSRPSIVVNPPTVNVKVIVPRRRKVGRKLPNPDPTNYEVLRYLPVKKNLVIEILYHGCTNYEGRKVLLFHNCTYEKLMKQKTIDPHFSENKKFYSPCARFPPTEWGWCAAVHVGKTHCD